MADQREVELKFVIDRAAVDALIAHPMLECAPAAAKRTRSVYYDTPAESLRKAGVTLRVRLRGRTVLQTVKADAGVGESVGAGLFDRAEWETPVAGPGPDLGMIAGTAAEVPLRDADGAPVPAFETDVERRTWDLRGEGVEIEVVLDVGEVVAGDARQPLAEVELELKSGPPSALFDLARVLSAAAPLKIGVLTKSEQGYRLLRGKTATVQKTEAVALDADMSAAQAFAAIVGACVRHFRLNEPGLIAARDAEALHQARVALRRLRSAFSIFRPVIAGPQAEALRGELGRMSAVLGVARDLDVFIAKRLADASADEAVRRAVLRERERAYDAAILALDAPRFRGAMIDLIAWLACGDWRDGEAARDELPAFADAALDRFRRMVKRRGRGLAASDDEARHELRIAGKKLRYAAEFFDGLTVGKKRRRRRDAFMDALERMQADLGDLNDIATARALTEDLSERIGFDLRHETSRGDLAKLRASAERAHGELIDPGRFWRPA